MADTRKFVSARDIPDDIWNPLPLFDKSMLN